jgi:hypothetical protein
LGYDYCLKEECQERFVKRVRLAALGVNKAADYYVRADEVLPPPAPAPVASGPDEDHDSSSDDSSSDDPSGHDPGSADAGRAEPHGEGRPLTTLERLRQREAELDQALAASYERFRRNQITAREMDVEQRRLVAEFNRLVMGENIRYRSMLRRRTGPKD